MPIYTRDNINYGGMLGNAMANRANYLQRRYDRVAQMGQNWGNAIQQSGQAIQNAFNQAAQYQYNKDQLANQQQFQAEQAALNRAQQLNMAREQQAWQARQNQLNRDNTYDIAQLNRQYAQEDKQDEYVLNLQKAQSHLGLVEAQYKADPNNPLLQEAYDNAKFNVAYWNKKAGRQTMIQPVPQPVVDPQVNQDGDGLKLDTQKQLLDDIFKNDILTDAQIQQANTIIDGMQDKDMQTVYRERLNGKGLSVEARKAKSAEELKKFDAEFQKMSPMDQDIWLDNHPGFGVLNGHLARKKK